MSLLLSDSSLCLNDFSRILYSPPSEWNLHVDVVDAPVVGSGLKQHIEYKITITAIPCNSLALDTKAYSVCLRFRELNRLWNQLFKIHRQLYLHGTYPAFSPARLFGNTEPAVIAERTEAIKRFLNFVFNSEVLRKSTSLHHFFEGVEEIETMNDITEPIATEEQATRATISVANEESTGAECTALESDCQEVPDQIAKPDFKEGQSSVDSVNEAVNQFNSSNPSKSTSNLVASRSSSCFLFDFPEANLQSNFASCDDSSASQICIRGSRSSESLAVDGSENSFVKNVLPRIANFAGRHVKHNPEIYDNCGSSHSSTHNFTNSAVIERNPVSGALPVLFPFTGSLPENVKSGSDYLNVAAQFISAAQKAESENAFELAFQCYKGAVKVLLQGVQLERDLSKRNRVRKKTAKYLLKAEKLYRSYLSFDGSTFEATSLFSTAVQDPSLLAFQSSNTLLKTLRIVDVLPSFTAKNRVFVVENVLHNDQQKYVMKLLQKSNVEKSFAGLLNKSIIPVEIPHMVQLHKFFETDSCIILLLEYLSYGRLWDFLATNSSDSVFGNSQNTNSLCLEQRDPYKGRHICFSLGDSEDATDVAVTEDINQKKGAVNPAGADSHGEFFMYRKHLTAEEGPRQLRISSSSDPKIVEAEEEAPAPINLQHVVASDVETSALLKALSEAKLFLKQGCHWKRDQLPEVLIAYWISQLCNAIYFLHSQGIIIRDLRPDNLLLDGNADLKLTFCSHWQSVTPCLDDCAVDNLYTAPEVLSVVSETTDAADRWSVGALLFELLCGQKLSELCLHDFESLKDLSLPDSIAFSFAARDLLSRLLVRDAERRLSDDDLRVHPFFEAIINNDEMPPRAF